MKGHTYVVHDILRLPGGQQIISCSYDGSIRIWDLESGTQVGEAWKDEEGGSVFAIALSPDGKTIASGNEDGAMRFWDINTGKVVNKWMGHTDDVQSVRWSPDGGRVVSGSRDETFRVWDVKNNKTILILAPIMSKKKDDHVWAICDYSPNGEMIATGGDNYGLKVWDAKTGELLKTIEIGFTRCLAWTSESKSDALVASKSSQIGKFDVTTWTEIATAQLWNLANNQPIGPPLHHEGRVRCAAFSADGKLLVTGCWSLETETETETHIYTWDVFAILREAGLEDLLSDNKPRTLICSSQNTVKKPLLDADATRRRRPPIKDARRIPRGFFDDARDFETSRRVASHGQRDRRTLSTRQYLLGRLTSLWRRPDSHGVTERETISRPHPLSWAQQFVSGMLHKRNGTEVELRETPEVEVPCTRGKPRNYHATKKKPFASSSRPSDLRTTQQPSAATQNIPSSSQGQPTITTTSEALPAVATTTSTSGTTSRRNITVIQAGWWTRFLLWIGLDAETELMESSHCPWMHFAKPDNLATKPYRKIKVNDHIQHTLHLPGGQRIIIYSLGGSFRVWDLERSTQVGEEWEDKERGVGAIALSPDGKTVATGSDDGTMKLWNVDKGKVIKKLTGHTKAVHSVCWSPDGGRVVSDCWGAFRVWDVQSGKTIVGPIETGGNVFAVCYSPDGKMIATAGGELEVNWGNLKIWHANTGELFKALSAGNSRSLIWTSDGKTLISGGYTKIDTATWTDRRMPGFNMTKISLALSPNERILARTSIFHNKVQLWNFETNQPIGTPLHHQHMVHSATFSADGKFLVTRCFDRHLYTWDVSAIVKEAGVPAPKMKGAPRIPQGFFDDALREANACDLYLLFDSLTNMLPVARFASWRRSKPHRATKPDIQSRSHPLSWTRNLVSGILRKRDGSDIQLREVEVPCTAGKPRNYHATKKKPPASSSRPPNIHTTQQPSGATQNAPTSPQLPPPIATTSALSAMADITETSGTPLSPHITVTGWRARFMGCICCMPIQNAGGHH
ncbi:WD40 repeat-like protein [Suillus weaverae]|nr:WD40 repeat-like protein [Suillus weaverae]